jgi:hypothetical protein
MDLYGVFSWSLIVGCTLLGRFTGSAIGRRTGARHVVAWFGAVVSLNAVVMLLNTTAGCPVRDFAKNSLPAGLVYGTFWATVIEVVMITIHWVAPKQSATPETLAERLPATRFRLRSLLVVAVFGVVLMAAYRFVLLPSLRFNETRDRIQMLVQELAQHQPTGVSIRQWSFVVGWTGTAVGNIFFVPSSVKDNQKYYDFADEFEQRLQGNVDMSTINWVWDQYEELSEIGRGYSERFRPTTPERLRLAENTPPEAATP